MRRYKKITTYTQAREQNEKAHLVKSLRKRRKKVDGGDGRGQSIRLAVVFRPRAGNEWANGDCGANFIRGGVTADRREMGGLERWSGRAGSDRRGFISPLGGLGGDQSASLEKTNFLGIQKVGCNR